jgi:HlyD family secretion protein
MKKVLLIGLPAVVIIAAVLFFWAGDGSASKDNEVKTVEVVRGEIVDKALAIGQIEPEHEIAVKSKVAGIVRKVYVDVGETVSAGDPLFDVKPDPTPVEYANAGARWNCTKWRSIRPSANTTGRPSFATNNLSPAMNGNPVCRLTKMPNYA